MEPQHSSQWIFSAPQVELLLLSPLTKTPPIAGFTALQEGQVCLSSANYCRERSDFELFHRFHLLNFFKNSIQFKVFITSFSKIFLIRFPVTLIRFKKFQVFLLLHKDCFSSISRRSFREYKTFRDFIPKNINSTGKLVPCTSSRQTKASLGKLRI